MINNINTLQNLPESSGLSTYTDLYLKQSLANLGQRFSVKGDGLYTGEFSIYDILDIDYDESVHKYSYAHINIKTEYTAESTSYGITLSYIDNNSDINPIKTIPLEGDLPYKTNDNIETKGSPINFIKYYEKGGYIKKLDDEYRTAFAGYNSSNEIKEITIDSFLINNNSISDRLGSGLRFFSSYNGKDTKTGKDLYTIRALSCKLLSARQNIYSFTLYDTMYHNSTFEEFKEFIYNEVIGDAKSLSVDNVINSLLENNILVVHKDKEGNPWEDNIFECNDTGTGSVTFDINVDSLIGDYNLDIEVRNTAVMFSYDIAVFYPLISEYYNNELYSDNIALKKKIVTKIVTQIFNDYNKEYTKFVTSKSAESGIAVTDYTVDSLDIYLPLNYKFIYSCNSNNHLQIYNSVSDISVEYTEDLKGEIYKILQGEKSEQIMICSISDSMSIDNKFNVYCFSVTYSRDNIVDDINVSKKFTLPYIDANGYWCINDISTSIYARGKDGGQPNIIMTYTDTSQNTNIILSSFRKDELESLDWRPTKVRIRPLDDNNNLEASTYHILNTMMPVNINSLNENLITLLEHAIILNINSVNSEDTEESTSFTSLANGLGKDCVIPTFWALNKVQDEEAFGTENDQYKYEFAYVKQPGAAWAVDMNYLSNAEGIVKHYMNIGIEPDNYEHSWLVFDNIKTTFKNNTNTTNNQITVWPVILNKRREKYAGIFGSDTGESSRYDNDLNITIGFYDNIIKNNVTGYITDIEQNNYTAKYFSVDTKNQIKKVINYSNYEKEFIPNAVSSEDTSIAYGTIIPMLDLSEVFVRNQSTFNRQNILTLDSNSYIYNAYIGSAFDLDDKSVLHIGSSNTNPNIGEITLMSHDDKSNFAKMNQIDIDFDNIHLNGNVVTKGSSWTLYTSHNGNNKAWHMTTPIGYIGNLFTATDATQDNAVNVLMYNKQVQIMPAFTLPGGDEVQEHNENISYLNLNYFFDNVARIDGYSPYNCEFRGDFVEYRNNCYFLQLQTDIEESSILYNTEESRRKYLLTNPIEFSYTNDYGGKMIVNVREIVSSTSHPVMYTNENIN